MSVIRNIVEWLSSKKTKDAITASIPLIAAGIAKEMPWLWVCLSLAGVWLGTGVAQGLADRGKEAAKIKALSDAELAARVSDLK